MISRRAEVVMNLCAGWEVVYSLLGIVVLFKKVYMG
jgi:hypothetical protein